MMWRPVHMIHLFLPLVSIATFWGVVYAQSDTNGPSNTNPMNCIPRRYWWTSMWGFIVTLVALTMDAWGATKNVDKGTLIKFFATLCYSALNPLIIIWGMLECTMLGLAMLGNLRKALGDDVVAPMYPWSKSHIKIISGCDVIVNFSIDAQKEIRKFGILELKVIKEDLSEALVIGRNVANSSHCNVQLTGYGQLALLRSNVLPPYDELKFLRGNTSLGMAIASVQAIGYIYGVIVHCVQGLQVSPIEAIACILNLVILMKGFLHNFSSLGHRPLLIYLIPQEEAKFIEECKNIQDIELKVASKLKLGISIGCVVVVAAGLYFSINFLKSLSLICVVPIILFEVNLVLGGIEGFVVTSNYDNNAVVYLVYLIVLLNLVGYVWALVVTFKYWKGEDFDVQSSNYLSQVLPYIG